MLIILSHEDRSWLLVDCAQWAKPSPKETSSMTLSSGLHESQVLLNGQTAGSWKTLLAAAGLQQPMILAAKSFLIVA